MAGAMNGRGRFELILIVLLVVGAGLMIVTTVWPPFGV